MRPRLEKLLRPQAVVVARWPVDVASIEAFSFPLVMLGILSPSEGSLYRWRFVKWLWRSVAPCGEGRYAGVEFDGVFVDNGFGVVYGLHFR